MLLGSAAPAGAATVVSGFSDAAVAAASAPTTVAWLPDDRIVVLEQAGRVRVGPPSGTFATALTLPNICPGGERGLLGFAHDPGFLSNALVYLYYTRDADGSPGGCVNRVSRFVMSGDAIDLASEVVLLDNISSVNGNHNGGDLDFGSDGFLYVSVGDAGRDPRGDSGSAGANDAAQDLSLLNGKILRVTRDGQPAPGNPLVGAGTAQCATRGNTPSTPPTHCQEIFAYGLRNPYRIAFDRNDGSSRLFVNDVGQGTFEEVNQAALGGNFGWPEREGGCPQGDTPPCPGPPAGLIDPLTFYGRDTGTVITGGAFVPDGLWPPQYDGAYLFADAGSGRIWIRFADGSVDYAAPLATGAGGISDMAFGFDAEGRAVLYYVQSGGGIRKITPTSSPASSSLEDLRFIATAAARAYDTGAPGIAPVGVAGGNVAAGTTRRVDLDPPTGARAALVNVTYAENVGVGFVKLWATRGLRPATSSVNADSVAGVAANAAIVPLDSEGSFILQATMASRIVVDVLGWFGSTTGAVSDGRYVSLEPARLVDTRLAAGASLPGGSPNPYQRDAAQNGVGFTARGLLGVPSATTDVEAVVVSIAAIGNPTGAGYVGIPSPAGDTSIVNVLPGDTRSNLAVVPVDDLFVRTLGVDHIVVDVLGYFTGTGSPASTAGLFSSVEPVRLVDTRTDTGVGELGAGTVQTVTIPGSSPAAAVVQNVTVTQPTAPGYLSTFPSGGATPVVSTVNFFPGQTRPTLAFTTMSGDRRVSYTALVATEAVVDVIGYFSA
jgi:glucose/arabinose dehydrogenase